jgi:hypothetical protein
MVWTALTTIHDPRSLECHDRILCWERLRYFPHTDQHARNRWNGNVLGIRPEIKRGVNHKKRDRLPFYNDHSFVVLAEREKRVGFWGAHGPSKLRQMQLVILSERQRYKKR